MTGVTPGRKEIRSELTGMLGVHLANMYNYMIRLQDFHWNAEGPRFYSAHALFEEYFEQIWQELDLIAERMRALGAYAPASLKQFFELSHISDRERPEGIDAMYDDLITCSVVVREYCAETSKIASLLSDDVTVEMLTRHLGILERAIWKFRSSLRRAGKAYPDADSKLASHRQRREAKQNGFLNIEKETSPAVM